MWYATPTSREPWSAIWPPTISSQERFRNRIPGLNLPILAMIKLARCKQMNLTAKTSQVFSSGSRVVIPIPIVFQFHIVLLGLICFHWGTWCMAPTKKNLPSIRRLGLLPGGTRGGRNHVHLALDCLLSTMNDALRPESDCILIARPGAASDLNPVITQSRYVLTDQTIPFSRFCGVWSLVDRAWIEIPEPAELSRMNDYDSDIDLATHICHHQLYWEKKNENELDNFTWTRSEYVNYVSEQISDLPTATKFLNCFR